MASIRDVAFISEQLCYLAEEEQILIVPTFTETNTIHAITGDFGPFVAGVPAEVPLWVALRLKSDQHCRVVPPQWMTIEYLQRAKVEEREKTGTFFNLPFYYIEISRLLLSSWAREDIDNADAVETLLEDVQTLRNEKMQRGVDSVLKVAASRDTPRLVDLTHASSMEVNSLRHTFFKALDRIVEAGEMPLGGAGAGARGGGGGGGGGSGSYGGSAASSSYAGGASQASSRAGAGGGAGGASEGAPSATAASSAPLRRLPLRARAPAASSSSSSMPAASEGGGGGDLDPASASAQAADGGGDPAALESSAAGGGGAAGDGAILPPEDGGEDGGGNGDDAAAPAAPAAAAGGLKRFRGAREPE